MEYTTQRVFDRTPLGGHSPVKVTALYRVTEVGSGETIEQLIHGSDRVVEGKEASS